MMVDFWADYYAQLRSSGKTEMYEDDDFDINAILSELEANEVEPDAPPEDWEEVESWETGQHD